VQAHKQINEGRYVSLKCKTIQILSNKREYLKDLISEMETNSKWKNVRDMYRSISEFKMGY